MSTTPLFFLFLSILCSLQTSTLCQPVCNGVLITYHYRTGEPIEPTRLPSDPANQPYRFESTLTVRNNAPVHLKGWRVFVGFRHGELLVSAGNAVLADGTPLPANVSGGAIFSGSPAKTDLKTAIETAGNDDEIQAVVNLVGTQFGVGEPNVPLPDRLNLTNDGYTCPNNLTVRGNDTTVCCKPEPNAKTSVSTDFSPLQTGDLSIMYDVTMSYGPNYWVQVTISNNDPYGRLEDWNLSWEWMEGEFINAMRGAYPKIVNLGECIFGVQGQFYSDLSKALSCDKRPTIVDLPSTRTNDTNLGRVPFCCRNGTILPRSVDEAKSKSSFLMEVYKMPPELNRSQLSPPQNWAINSTVGSTTYQCGQPVRVGPSLLPDPTGLPSRTAAVASWQVVCNATRPKKPACCVSFSSFFNDSVVPCPTCACGCAANPGICSVTEPAMLMPAQALLVPFDNRTRLARTFASQNNRKIPNPMPCGDNCGVSINWHVVSDFEKGWSARVTLFNWGEDNISDWFAAVKLDKAMPGLEKVYSMDGQVLDSDRGTLFLKGLPNYNYLFAEQNGSNPRKDPPVPGKQQSVISFQKKQTPGIHVARGDGFPASVWFNGEECSVPTVIPSGGPRRAAVAFTAGIWLFISLLHDLFSTSNFW